MGLDHFHVESFPKFGLIGLTQELNKYFDVTKFFKKKT